MDAAAPLVPVRFEPGQPPRPARVVLVDQTRLPGELAELALEDVEALVDAMRRLVVRGAPALGIAGAYGLCLAAGAGPEGGADEAQLARVRAAAERLGAARPTAVNLRWALERVVRRAEQAVRRGLRDLAGELRDEAEAIAREEAERCEAIGRAGLPLVRDGTRVLTHCHTGALATGGLGTAVAPILLAHRAQRRVRVYVDETRPLLQGSRLTAWELGRAGVEVVLLPDAAAAGLMARGEIDLVLVGADRIARNGDVCNKVGTYGLAVVAARHGIPFYVAAPTTTLDPRAASGAEIPIEQRPAAEVTSVGGRPVAPAGTAVHNPAFDVTPAELVSGLLCERGLLERPVGPAIARLLAGTGAG